MLNRTPGNCFIFCPMKALLSQLCVTDCKQGLEVNTNDVAKIKGTQSKKRKEEEGKEKKARPLKIKSKL